MSRPRSLAAGDNHRVRESGVDVPLHVALLSPCHWPEVRRGTERFVAELAAGLLAAGHVPTLITSHPGPRSRRREQGMEIVRLRRPPDRPLLALGFEEHLTHVPLSYMTLRSGSYDLVHATYPADALAAARWAKGTGRPALLSYMGVATAGHLRARRGRRAVLKRGVRGCDVTVTLSAHAAAEFERNLGVRSEVISPPVDTEAFSPHGERAAAPTIICPSATGVPHKNIGLLLDAFALVRRRHPDARLVLSKPSGGPAPTPAAPGVEWHDLDDRSALASAYAGAWVAALPSVDEAFGLVIAEALACGTPVVGFDGGAIPEIIDRPEIGRLFAALEPGALAEALLECLDLAPDPATARACRERALPYSTARCTDAYLRLYERLLQAPRP